MSACDGLREAFSARPDVVATAAGRKLTTDRMLGMMRSVPSGAVTKEGAEFLANLWVDLHLFARARVTLGLAADSATVARVMWPQLTQARLAAWHDSLAAGYPPPTDAVADSVFDAGRARLFQHILVQPTGSTATDTVAARTRITGVLAQIRRGRDFVGFTKDNGDASRADSGFLPLGPRGQFVPAFEEAAWALEPGQVSEVVQSPFGFHLIRRTPKEESRSRFLAFAGQTIRQQRDSAYVVQLGTANRLEVNDGVARAVRDAVADPDAARRSNRPLVRFARGAFTTKDLGRWLEAFAPGAGAQLAAQPDSVIRELVENLAQNTLVLRVTDSAKYALPAVDWQAVQLSYRAAVDQLAAALALTDSVVADSTRPEAARLDSAASRVERVLDLLIAGQSQFRPLPPSLAGYLRETGGAARVNRAGLARVMELYAAARQADSTAAAAAAGGAAPGAQPGVIRPAPGPAPVPGGPPAPAPPP